MGRSRGGFGTEVHAAVDAPGNPLRFAVTPGQDSDIGAAPELIAGIPAGRVLADKGYDSDAFVEAVEKAGAEAVIPPRSNRVAPREYDRHWYKDRNLVERFFNKIKNCRRVATRYEKTKRNFEGFLHIAGIMVWLS